MDQCRYIDCDWLQRLAPRECEQALHQSLGPLRRLKRTTDQPLFALAADAAPLQHIEAADDRGQKIVEVVGDAAGELSHRLEFLRLAQRILGERQFGLCRLFRCDVAAIGIDQRAFGRRMP